MSLGHGSSIVRSGLVLHYDMANTKKSWKGAPTTNRIFTTPIPLSLYAYVTGPTTETVIDATFKSKSVNRYTISQVINTARAAIFVPNGSLALSTPYAFSCIWKYNGTNTISPSFIIDASKGSPEITGANTFSSFVQTNVALTNGWTYSKLEFTLSASPTLGSNLTFGISTGSDSTYLNNTFDVYNVQFEQNTFATPYVEGIRSNTQALVDLTGSNTVTASSLTYASDNTFSFNGTSNYISMAQPAIGLTPNNWTISGWIRPTSTSVSFFLTPQSAGIDHFLLYDGGSKRLGVQVTESVDINNRAYYTASNSVPLNTWTHFSVSINNLTIKTYINSVESLNQTESIAIANWDGGWILGQRGNSTFWYTGQISTLQVYNKALSAAEVSQNFEATRTRYGI